MLLEEKGMGPKTLLWPYTKDEKAPTFRLHFIVKCQKYYQPQKGPNQGPLAGGAHRLRQQYSC